MEKTNLLTYAERRKPSNKEIFNRTLAGVLALAGVAIFGGNQIVNDIPKIKEIYSNYLAKKVDELNRNDYLKLRKHVCGEYEINPVKNQGWRYYTERLFEKSPKANKIGSFNQWSTFLKVYNGGGNPTIGKKIRFPEICE